MENTLSQRQVIDLAISIGYNILKNGGEINRVEDTVKRIALAYGMDFVHVFAINTTIIITVEKDGVSLTQSRRILNYSTNLDMLEQLNSLSRKISKKPLSYKDAMREIKLIEERHRYPEWVIILSYALIGGSFALFFGGDIQEFCVGFLVGSIIRMVLLFLNFFTAPPFVSNTTGSAMTVILIKLSTFIVPSLNVEVTTIGVLMNLVPGVLITNCIRDLIATDYNSGMAKMIEAFFIAAAIALGVAVSIFWR